MAVRDAFTETTTMKAVLNPRYGSPDVLEIRQVPIPNQNGRRFWSASMRRRSAEPTAACSDPPVFRSGCRGLLRPKRTILGMGLRGGGRGGRWGVTLHSSLAIASSACRGCLRAHAEYLCVPRKGCDCRHGGRCALRRTQWSAKVPGMADTYLRAFRLKRGHNILSTALRRHRHGGCAVAKFYGAKVTASGRDAASGSNQSLGRTVQWTTRRRTSRSSLKPSIGVFDAVAKTTYSVAALAGSPPPKGSTQRRTSGPWCQNPLLRLWSMINGATWGHLPAWKAASQWVMRVLEDAY